MLRLKKVNQRQGNFSFAALTFKDCWAGATQMQFSETKQQDADNVARALPSSCSPVIPLSLRVLLHTCFLSPSLYLSFTCTLKHYDCRCVPTQHAAVSSLGISDRDSNYVPSGGGTSLCWDLGNNSLEEWCCTGSRRHSARQPNLLLNLEAGHPSMVSLWKKTNHYIAEPRQQVLCFWWWCCLTFRTVINWFQFREMCPITEKDSCLHTLIIKKILIK